MLGGDGGVFNNTVKNIAESILEALESKKASSQDIRKARGLLSRIIKIYHHFTFSNECADLYKRFDEALKSKTLSREKLNELKGQEFSIESLLEVRSSKGTRNTLLLSMYVFRSLEGFTEVGEPFFNKLSGSISSLEKGKISKDEEIFLKNFFRALLPKPQKKASPARQFWQELAMSVRSFFI